MTYKTKLPLVVERIEKLRSILNRNPFVKKVIYIIAIAFFLYGVLLSVKSNPELLQNISCLPIIAIILFLTPINIFVMALELQSSARMLNKNIPLLDALRITTIASVSNFLPLPGAVIVKVSYFIKMGISLKDSSVLNIFIAFIWLGCALIYSGIALIAAKADANVMFAAAMASCVAGGIILAVIFYGVTTLYNASKELLNLMCLRLVMLVNAAFRLLLCFAALGIHTNFVDTSVLILSRAISALFIIIPSGLGIAELLCGLMAPVLNLSVGSGYLASALERITDMVFLILILITVLVIRYSLPTKEIPDEKN